MAEKIEWDSAGIPRFPENSRVMQVHEAMVDLISGRTTSLTFLDGLNGLKSNFELDDDEFVNNSDYEEEKKEYCGFSKNFLDRSASKPIAPHPQIKQLTSEDGEPGESTSSDVNVNIQSEGDITEALVPQTGTTENKAEVDAAPEERSGLKKDDQEEEEERLASRPEEPDKKPELDMSTGPAVCIAKQHREQKAKKEKKDKKIHVVQQPVEEKGKAPEQPQELNHTEEEVLLEK